MPRSLSLRAYLLRSYCGIIVFPSCKIDFSKISTRKNRVMAAAFPARHLHALAFPDGSRPSFLAGSWPSELIRCVATQIRGGGTVKLTGPLLSGSPFEMSGFFTCSIVDRLGLLCGSHARQVLDLVLRSDNKDASTTKPAWLPRVDVRMGQREFFWCVLVCPSSDTPQEGPRWSQGKPTPGK